MSDFDADLSRLLQIRAATKSARPKRENPSWLNTHRDLEFVLSFVDKIWAEYSISNDNFARVTAELDAARRDAERYRWLKSQPCAVNAFGIYQRCWDGYHFYIEYPDNAIDAAILAEKSHE